jgi:non-canonical purine NTP pyrophosphatase (RdgB/HAM1 family)
MVLYFITSNLGKFKEVKEIIPNIEMIDLDLAEIQELDAHIIIKQKLKLAIKKHSGEFFCEDTSLYINSLNGFPGPLIKWLLKSIGDKGTALLVSKYKDKRAIAKTIIGYTNGSDIKFFEGVLEGEIVFPKGSGGFGWDKIFLPIGYNKTLGEMTLEEKNKISMRKIAFEKLRDFLKSREN